VPLVKRPAIIRQKKIRVELLSKRVLNSYLLWSTKVIQQVNRSLPLVLWSNQTRSTASHNISQTFVSFLHPVRKTHTKIYSSLPSTWQMNFIIIEKIRKGNNNKLLSRSSSSVVAAVMKFKYFIYFEIQNYEKKRACFHQYDPTK
jgi:hypothetical protein